MVISTRFMRSLKERFPGLLEVWEDSKLISLGFREGDIEVIHELFGRDFIHTGIVSLLAFTHGDCYPVSSIEQILDISEDEILQALSKLIKQRIVYSEKFGHPTAGGWHFYYADRDLLLVLVRDHKLTSAKQRITKLVQSEEPLLVFVSSVMNKELEDLSSERNIARVAIEDIEFARPWLFEETPASSEPLPEGFLRKVERSDFLVLILSKHITDNVKQEYGTAVNSNVPRLLFLKGDVKRTHQTKEFVKRASVKYKEFWNLNDLRAQINASLMDEILRAFRRKK